MRRLFCAVLVMAALAFSATPAAAQEVAVDEIDLSAIGDGGACTGVPDAIPGVFDFTSACAGHDLCYAGGEQQAVCDDQFRDAMVASCIAAHPSALDPVRYVCLTFAQLYYAGVRLFGGFFI